MRMTAEEFARERARIDLERRKTREIQRLRRLLRNSHERERRLKESESDEEIKKVAPKVRKSRTFLERLGF